MSEHELIAAARGGDIARIQAALAAGTDVDIRDEHGWTALGHGAGAGHVHVVRLLLDRGANVFATGRDQRTPYLIALAASRVEAARVLKDAEARVGGDAIALSSGQSAGRPYCRGYELSALRRFPGWPQPDADHGLADDSILFVHRDYSVTRSIWAGESVVFSGAEPEWRRFCEEQLQFQPPDDFAWIPQPLSE